MSYNTVGVVPVNSYIEAVTRYKGITPIRGTAIRPLGARRYHNRSDIVVAENRVFLNYYGQAFVEWYPDDTFIVHPPKYCSAFMVGGLISVPAVKHRCDVGQGSLRSYHTE